MATILFFDPARCRDPDALEPASKTSGSSADVLLFTGVRRERLHAGTTLPSPCQHEPMFDDTAPPKPTGRKRGRGKNA